jgi:hypothetical protein
MNNENKDINDDKMLQNKYRGLEIKSKTIPTSLPPNQYQLNYQNTNKIPITNIVKSLMNNLPIFLKESNESRGYENSSTSDKNYKYHITFEKAFNYNILQTAFSKSAKRDRNHNIQFFNLNETLTGNIDEVSLDKLLLFCWYSSSSRNFHNINLQNRNSLINETKKIPSLLKHQLKIDYARNSNQTFFNTKEFSSTISQYLTLNMNSNNYTIADIFYIICINQYIKNDMKINYNNINRMMLVFIQSFGINFSNLIKDYLMKLVGKNILFLRTLNNKIFITIKKGQEKIVYLHSCYMVLEKDNYFDPENIKGVFDLVFEADLIKNTYDVSVIARFNEKKFDLYDVQNDPKSALFGKGRKVKIDQKYMTKDYVAAGVSAFYVAGMPFLLGLGGSKKKTKRGKNKNYKNKTKKNR